MCTCLAAWSDRSGATDEDDAHLRVLYDTDDASLAGGRCRRGSVHPLAYRLHPEDVPEDAPDDVSEEPAQGSVSLAEKRHR